MIAKNKTIQKLISSLIIVSMLTPAILLSFKPKEAKAQWVVWDPVHTAVTIKIVAQEIFRQFLMLAARKLLNKMTQNTIGWINSGFHGNPLYLENSQSFFKDIAKSEIKNLINTFGYDGVRFPYGKDFALNTISNYQRTLEDNATYTLSKIVDDPVVLNNYRNDFNVGGWNGFITNTQYPQNNYLGFQMLATEQLAKKLDGTTQTAAQKINTTLQQGGGFLSPQVCPTNPAYNNGQNEFVKPKWNESAAAQNIPYLPPAPEFNTPGSLIPSNQDELAKYDQVYNYKLQGAKYDWETDNTCPGGLVNTTPGGVVGQTIKDTLGSSGRRGELAQALGNSVAAILDALMNHFLEKGLNALSGKNGQTNSQGNPIIPPDDDTTLDNFYYGGQSINSAGDTPGVVIPQNPPIDVNVINTNPIQVTLGGNTPQAGCTQLGQNEADFILPLLNGGTAPQTVADMTNSKFNLATGSQAVYYSDNNTLSVPDFYAAGPQPGRPVSPGTGEPWDIVWRCGPNGNGEGSNGNTPVNTGGTSTNGGGNTTNPNPGLPYIQSVTPATAAGGETMTIIGFDLSSTVRFSSNVNGKATTVGNANVSSDKKKVTVTIPTGLTPGATSVQDIVFNDSSKVSNSVIITIGGGTTGPISATVSSSYATSGNRGGLAFNPQNDTWLVVGALSTISGRIMDNNGNAVSANEFQINTDSGVQVMGPKVAFAPNLNKYLVVWIGFPTNSGGTIYGRFVNTDGTPSGAVFPIFTDPGGGFSFLWPNGTLQYDSKNQKFVFVWEYRHPGLDVNLITISASGTVGPLVSVTNGGTGNNTPALAINENADEYCVAYDKRSDSPTKVAVTKVDAVSLAVGAETTLAVSPSLEPSIAYNSVNKQYLVGWGQYSAIPTIGRVLSSCNINSVVGSTSILNSAGGAPSITYNPKSNKYAVIVMDQNDGGNKYNILSAAKAILASGVAFGSACHTKSNGEVECDGNFYPSIAPNTNDGSFGAISAINFNPTYFAPGIK